MPDRLYCTVKNLIDDLGLQGADPDEATLLRYVRSASDFIDRRIGMFIPETATKWFDGNGEKHILVDPLLAATTVTDDGDTIASTQYILYPRNRHWSNGPYTRLTVDPDATSLSVWTCERDVVSIAGRWGKYEESIATGTTLVTPITASDTTILVANSTLVSVGMVLLIDSEQMLVTATGATGSTSSTTNEAVDASEDEIDVTNVSTWRVGMVLLIDSEQMLVLDIRSSTLVVARGWNGTKRTTHSTSTAIYNYPNYTVKRAVNGTTAATHSASAAISRYVVPYDINTLARQLAALVKKMADSGYAGRSGSAELGETFYYKMYPSEIKDIHRNYRITSI